MCKGIFFQPGNVIKDSAGACEWRSACFLDDNTDNNDNGKNGRNYECHEVTYNTDN